MPIIKKPTIKEIKKIRNTIFTHPGIRNSSIWHIVFRSSRNSYPRLEQALEILENEWEAIKFEKNGWFPHKIIYRCYLCRRDLDKIDKSNYKCRECNTVHTIKNKDKTKKCPICNKKELIIVELNNNIAYHCMGCNDDFTEDMIIHIL